MNYTYYKHVRDAVWSLIIEEEITALPVGMVDLCRRLGIDIYAYEPTDGNCGASILVDGEPRIFVDKNMSRERQRFTAAHELGHILLGHVGMYKLVNRDPNPNDNPIEQAANVFASRLLAPACVLWGCGVKNADDVVKLCRISKQAAEFRMERMDVLYKRGKFLTSPLERQVYEQFKPFIDQNKLY